MIDDHHGFDYIDLFPRPKKENQKILDECTKKLMKEAKEHPIEIKLYKWPDRKENNHGKT